METLNPVDAMINQSKDDVSQLVDAFFALPLSQELFAQLDYQFKDSLSYFTAFVHTSFANENKKLNIQSNERLEFLGDSLLNAIVTAQLYQSFPQFEEGALSRLRNSLINENSLANLGRSIGLQNLIMLGNGLGKSKGRDNQRVVGDAFEALLGAIFLDSNFEQVKKVLLKIIDHWQLQTNESFFSDLRSHRGDAKTQLQEATLKLYQRTPEYRDEKVSGIQGFVVSLYINNQFILQHQSNSKKDAEKFLAQQALENKLYVM